MTAFQEFVKTVEIVTGRPGRQAGAHIRLLCPAHDDHDPSLDVREGDDGRPLVVCRSHGCKYEDVCRAIGREPYEFVASGGRHDWTPFGPAIGVYDYTDETGQVIFQVCRTADKQFPQRRPDPSQKSGWRWKLDDVRRVLYRLPEVLAGISRGETIYVCEGEKDVETLRRLGVVATCNPGGAGKWRDEHSSSLAGAHVVVVADRDDVGREHASKAAAALAGSALTLLAQLDAAEADAAGLRGQLKSILAEALLR